MTTKNIRIRGVCNKAILYIAMIVLAVVFLLPFVIMVLGSIQDILYFNGDFTKWWPKQITFKNYKTILDQGLMVRWFINSLIISVVPMATSALISTLLGYVFAKKNFVGKDLIFWLFISMIMVTAFFLMRQSMISIPDSLLEAAKLDGCTELQTFFRVVLPLSTQSIATISTLGFMSNFNNLFYPLIYTSTDKMYPMPVGLASLITQGGNFGFQMAGAVLNFIPTLIIFLCLQKYFTQGIATSGIKE